MRHCEGKLEVLQDLPVTGQVYYNRSNHEYIWSLGFLKYTCLAIKLRAENTDGNVLGPNMAGSRDVLLVVVCVWGLFQTEKARPSILNNFNTGYGMASFYHVGSLHRPIPIR